MTSAVPCGWFGLAVVSHDAGNGLSRSRGNTTATALQSTALLFLGLKADDPQYNKTNNWRARYSDVLQELWQH